MTRGVAPSALRRPISRMRSVTDTSMMFMTPMPPTMSEMAAIPPSRMVSVWSTDVLAAMSEACEVMVKSASAAVGDAVQLQQEVVGLLVGAGQVGRRAGLDGDGAHRVARRAAEDALGARGDGDDRVSSGSVVLDDEVDEPVDVSTPTTVRGTPFTSTVWPTGSPR